MHVHRTFGFGEMKQNVQKTFFYSLHVEHCSIFHMQHEIIFERNQVMLHVSKCKNTPVNSATTGTANPFRYSLQSYIVHGTLFQVRIACKMGANSLTLLEGKPLPEKEIC